jgi:hypothetical protein
MIFGKIARKRYEGPTNNSRMILKIFLEFLKFLRFYLARHINIKQIKANGKNIRVCVW